MKSNFNIRSILKVGATVFGISAFLLVFLPSVFLDLLDLDSTSDSLIWSMRMIGITLVALSGNMWFNSLQSDEVKIKAVGLIMCLSATALGVLTLLIPANLNWFSILYAIVGFGFGFAYLVALAMKRF